MVQGAEGINAAKEIIKHMCVYIVVDEETLAERR